MRCPDCKADNREGAKFCDECGHRLSDAVAATPINFSDPKSYTPKFLTEKILTTRSAVQGERKRVTVLFADVAGYTSIAENLDPEDVHQLMDGCFRILMDRIHGHEGTINQFTGDGVMALFGAPLAHEDHAQRACAAALEIQEAVAEYALGLRERYGFDFQLRIGLNSGQVVVGAIGDDLRMDYTAIGDTANLAARLQSHAEPGAILVSGSTYRLARSYFSFEPVGPLVLKGKKEPQDVHRLAGKTAIETRMDAASVSGLTRFVGRQTEIGALESAFGKVRDGQGRVVGVVGEAGSGKSRLLLEFRNRLNGAPLTHLEGSCSCLHHGASVPYMPILEVLRSYFEFQHNDSQAARQRKLREKLLHLEDGLRPAFAPLQELLSLPVEDETHGQIDPEQRKIKSFEAFRDLLVAHSAHQPVLLVLEDLHWIDKDSEQALGYLVDALAAAPILLLLLYRPEYTHPWQDQPHCTVVAVDPLPPGDGGELVGALLGPGQVAPELTELILGKAGGNPLFAEELTRSLQECGGIQKSNGHYRLSADPASIEIPDTVQGIIAARIDRLDAGLKTTLQTASVIGQEFALPVLQTIMDPEPELTSHLQLLQGSGLIAEKRRAPEPVYRFHHALTRDVAYEGLLHQQTRAIHEAVGHAIETLYPERLADHYELLAHHYCRSDRGDKALEYLDHANAKAIELRAYEQALRYFAELTQRFEAASASRGNPERLVSALLRQVAPFIWSYQIKKYDALLNKYATEVTSLNNPAALIGFKSCKARCEFWLGDFDAAEDSLTFLQKACEEAQNIAPLPGIYQTLQWICLVKGKFEQVFICRDRSLSILGDGSKDLTNYCMSLCSAAWAYAWRGKWVDALESAQGAFDAADKHTDFGMKSMASWLKSIVYNRQGDATKAAEHGEQAVQYANTPFIRGTALGFLAWARCIAGEPKGAIETLEPTVAMMRAMSYRFPEVGFTGCLGDAYWQANDHEKARETFAQGLQLAEGCGMRYWVGWYHRMLGEIGMQTGDPMAGAHFEKGIPVLKEIGAENELALAYAGLGRVHRQRGNTPTARKLLQDALAILDRLGTLQEPDRIRADLVELGAE